MRRLRTTTPAILAALVLTLSSCGASDDADDTSVDSGSEAASETDGNGDASGGADDALFGTPADVGGPYGELRDGTWAVGPAGEVEFEVTGPNSVELVDVRPAEGWDVTDEDVDPDEIEVDFARGPVEIEIEIEIEGGILEIEIDQDIDPAEGGTFDVGEAGTVEVDVQDGRLVLGSVDLADGWSEVSRDEESDEIEIDFRRDGDGFVETWDFDADLDDGELEVEVDYEIEGQLSS